MDAEKRPRRRRRVVRLSEVDRLRLEEGVTEDEHRAPLTPPVLPDRASEDSDDAWGGGPDSNDRRLAEDVPPHWGPR